MSYLPIVLNKMGNPNTNSSCWEAKEISTYVPAPSSFLKDYFWSSYDFMVQFFTNFPESLLSSFAFFFSVIDF